MSDRRSISLTTTQSVLWYLMSTEASLSSLICMLQTHGSFAPAHVFPHHHFEKESGVTRRITVRFGSTITFVAADDVHDGDSSIAVLKSSFSLAMSIQYFEVAIRNIPLNGIQPTCLSKALALSVATISSRPSRNVHVSRTLPR